MEALCYLNGEFQSISEARIDPLDRGFLFGDALYEVMKVRSARIVELDAHLARLAGNLDRTGIGGAPELADACREMVARADLDVGFLYVQITRGVAPRSHLPPAGMTPTVFVLPATYEYSEPAQRPMRVVTQPDRRWGHCDLKSTSLMATVLGKMAAEEQQADENLLVSESGEIREAGQTNFFAVRNGILETHPADRHILPGVTRQLLLRFAREQGLEVTERAPLIDERNEWSEALVCGTLTGVQPVVELDGTPIATGEAGTWTRRLAEASERYELEQLEVDQAQPVG